VATSPFGPRSAAPRDNGTDRMCCPLATPTQVRKTVGMVGFREPRFDHCDSQIRAVDANASADALCTQASHWRSIFLVSGILADLFESFTEEICHFTVF
jgi:hypothetical protein